MRAWRTSSFSASQVGVVDLRVMFDLAWLYQPGVELLSVFLMPVETMCVD
jgi:hypothetical protein